MVSGWNVSRLNAPFNTPGADFILWAQWLSPITPAIALFTACTILHIVHDANRL